MRNDHARIGVTAKTLANHRSNISAALRWFAKQPDIPRHGMRLSADWAAFRDKIDDRRGLNAPYWLVFPHYDVKNRVDLNFQFDQPLTDLIDEYVHEFRPALLRGANTP